MHIEDEFIDHIVNATEFPLSQVYWPELCGDDAESAQLLTLSMKTSLCNHYKMFYDAAESLSLALKSDLERAFDRLGLGGEVVTAVFDESSSRRINSSNKRRGSSRSSHTAYRRQALEWLIANLHDPYPSQETKAQICYNTGSSLKDVDAWFTEMRRRIGWNRLRKQHFNNRRADILDAAAKHFHGGGERDLKADVRHAFVRMNLLVEDMYDEHYAESKLGFKFDKAMKDMTPELRAEAEKKRNECQLPSSAKRRLSFAESDTLPCPKRPHLQSLAPGHSDVSDPLPITLPVTSLLALSAEELGSGLLDVELGDFSQFDIPSSSPTFAPSVQSIPVAQPSPLLPHFPLSSGNPDLNFGSNNWVWNVPIREAPLEPFYDLLEPLNHPSQPIHDAIDGNYQFALHNTASMTDCILHPLVFSSSSASAVDELQIDLPAFPINTFSSLPAERTCSDEFSHISPRVDKGNNERS